MYQKLYWNIIDLQKCDFNHTNLHSPAFFMLKTKDSSHKIKLKKNKLN